MTVEQVKGKLPAPFVEYAHKKTRDFLRACVLDGATARFLEDESVKPRIQLTRKKAFLVTVMYFSKSNSGTEIGQEYGGGITRARVGQLIFNTFVGLRDSASEEIQSKYPLGDIPQTKRGQVNTLINRGLRRGSKKFLIADMARKGAAYEDIEASVGGNKVAHYRGEISKYGILVPYSGRLFLTDDIRNEMSDESLNFHQVKDLWVRVSSSAVHDRLRKERMTVSLTRLAVASGMYTYPRKVSLLVPILEAANVAIGHFKKYFMSSGGKKKELDYYFLRTVDLERAREVLNRAEQLKTYYFKEH